MCASSSRTVRRFGHGKAVGIVGNADLAVQLCGDIFTLRRAAIGGAGIAFIPDHSCRRELADGSLERVFPTWIGQIGSVYLVFTGSRGQPPAVRAFIDHLAAAFSDDLLLGDLKSSSPNG